MFAVNLYLNNKIPETENCIKYLPQVRGLKSLKEFFRDVYYLKGEATYYSIYDFDSLSNSCFNYCLKLFEEIPDNTFILLGISDISKIPNTILSRSNIIYSDNPNKPLDVTRLFDIKDIKELYWLIDKCEDKVAFEDMYLEFCFNYNREVFSRYQIINFINRLKEKKILCL